MDRNFGVGVLSFSLDAQVSGEMHILPATDFRAEDGRPEDVDSWKINASIANRLIAKLNARKNDLLIDYEHQSLRSQINGQPVVAAGWFKQMEWREGSGMWLKQVELTNRAKDMISNKELRYTSPVFLYDKTSGEITEIISVALTNTPALDGLQSLAALTNEFIKHIDPSGESSMSGQDLAALTTQVTNLTAQVTALTTERDEQKAKAVALAADLTKANEALAALTASVATEKEAAEKKAHADLLQTALSDGRLTPKQKAWAETQSLAALTAFLETAPVIVDGKLQHDKKNEGGSGEHGLTTEELAMCNSMQIDPKDFLATKTAK